MRSLWSTMHEGGHGLSYQGIAPELARSPLYGNASHGIGESQSRTWENLVGRSLPFWRGFYPEVQRRFPHLATVEVDDFYRGINRVERGLIRVEADEVTYSLHIIVRFELEQQLVAGTLAARGPAGGLERARWPSCSAWTCRTTCAACSRTSTGRGRRTATSRRTRSATSSRCRSGAALEEEHPDLDALLESGDLSHALRDAAAAALPPRPEVHAAGDARARGRRDRDRPAAVPRVPAREGRRPGHCLTSRA